MLNKIILGLVALGTFSGVASAQAAEYFELPATFGPDAQLTLITAFGVILGLLSVMWVVRKVIKTTNRS